MECIDTSALDCFNNFYPNGQLMESGQRIDGCLAGYYTEYHTNGTRKSEGFYVRGKRTGMWTFYYNNRVTAFQGDYCEDHRVNTWKWYSVYGDLTNEKQYTVGTADEIISILTEDGGYPQTVLS